MKIPRRILKRAGITSREWKQQKRHEARVLERSVEAFGFACAYTPASRKIDKLRKLVRDIRESLKVKNWGN